MSQKIPLSHPEVSHHLVSFLPFSPPSCYRNYYTCHVLTFYPFVSDNFLKPLSKASFSFVLFCLFVFCVLYVFCSLFFLLLLLLLLCIFGCGLRACVFFCACVLCARVFSPAASVDYGSFADRCSTWLELLRLKANTIRRGSVKTSRRTQSLAHSGDHTHKYRTQFHEQSRTC